MENVVLTIHLILAVLLTGVVLLQRSEGGGLGMGGGGGGVMTGRQAANALTRLTWIFGIALFVTSIALTIIAARQVSNSSIMDQFGGQAPTEAPATGLPGLPAYTPPPSTAGNPQVEPAHILKALMDQREGVAVAVLKATGADADAVSAQASAVVKSLPSASGASTAQAQFNRGSLQVIQAAEQFAKSLGDEYISTEHLLYGLAQQ